MSSPTIPLTPITSPRNNHLKRWASLLDAKGLKTHQQCLVSGKKLVQETLAQHPESCIELISHQTQSTCGNNAPPHVVQYQLTPSLFQKLDLLGTNYPLLTCHIPRIISADLAMPPQGLEVLCPFGDPHNLGALIRSCCAFNVSKLILLKEAAHPFHPKSIRSASGTVFNQKIFWGGGLTELNLREVLPWVIAVNLKGKNVSSWRWPKDVRILVGEEGLGLPDYPFSQILTIPQSEKAHSLNATIAASIVLFSYRQQYPLG